MIAAIDFGASATKAAVRIGDTAPRLLAFGIFHEFPSAVYLMPDGTFEVGARALAIGGQDPLRLVTQLKRRVLAAGPVPPAERTVHVGRGIRFPLVHGMAAILGHAYEAVRATLGSPPSRLVLTHPVSWAEPEVRALTTAARHAGIESPLTTMTEPEAVAHFHFRHTGRSPEPVAVFDLGACTFDLAVLSRPPSGTLETVFSRGLSTGGDDFDDAVFTALATRLDEPARDRVEALRVSEPYGMASAARELKETLSTDESAEFAFDDPLVPDVVLTRNRFEEALNPVLRPCVSLLREAVDAVSATTPVKLVLLSGGSTKVPRVRELALDIARAAGAEPVTFDGPVGPGHTVALGAAAAIRPPRLVARSWGTIALPTDVVALAGGRVAYSGRSRLIRVLDTDGGELGVFDAGGPPDVHRHLATDGQRIVSRTEHGLVERWRVDPVVSSPYGRTGSVLACEHSRWVPDRPNVTAAAIRGSREAWAVAAGSESSNGLAQGGTQLRGFHRSWGDRRPMPRFAGPVLGMAFVDAPAGLVVWGPDEIVRYTFPEGRRIAAAHEPHAHSVAVHPAAGMIHVRADGVVRGHTIAPEFFAESWRTEIPGHDPTLCCGTLDGRPVVLAHDTDARGLTALDGRTGAIVARLATGGGGAPDQLVATPDDGVFLVRRGRALDRLVLTP